MYERTRFIAWIYLANSKHIKHFCILIRLRWKIVTIFFFCHAHYNCKNDMEWFFSLDLQFKCPSKYVPETHPVGECFTGSKWYLFLFCLGEILKTKKQRNKEKTFPLIKGGSGKRSKILPTGNTWETRGSELTFAQRGSFRSPPNISAAAPHALPGIAVTAALPRSPVNISPSPNVSPPT